MKLEIITPEKKMFSGDVEMVRVPGTKGLFQILKNHHPIISSIDKGKIRVRTIKGEQIEFNINKGYIKCLNNIITILVQE